MTMQIERATDTITADNKAKDAKAKAPKVLVLSDEEVLAMPLNEVIELSRRAFSKGDEVWDSHLKCYGKVTDVVTINTTMRDAMIKAGTIKETPVTDNRPPKAVENGGTVRVMLENGDSRWYTDAGEPGTGKGRNLFHADMPIGIIERPKRRDTKLQVGFVDFLKKIHDDNFQVLSGALMVQLNGENVALSTKALSAGLLALPTKYIQICVDSITELYNVLWDCTSLEDLAEAIDAAEEDGGRLGFEAIMPWSVDEDLLNPDDAKRAKIFGIAKEKFGILRKAIIESMLPVNTIIEALFMFNYENLMLGLRTMLEVAGVEFAEDVEDEVVAEAGPEDVDIDLEDAEEAADEVVAADDEGCGAVVVDVDDVEVPEDVVEQADAMLAAAADADDAAMGEEYEADYEADDPEIIA